jgi:hypothetical protein
MFKWAYMFECYEIKTNFITGIISRTSCVNNEVVYIEQLHEYKYIYIISQKLF